MKQCPNCYAQIESEASKCKFCGVPLRYSYSSTRPPIKGEVTLRDTYASTESSSKVAEPEKIVQVKLPAKRSIGVTVFAWSFIIQGIVIASIPAIYGIKKIQEYPIVSDFDFAMFGFFGSSLLIMAFFFYFGIRLLLLKKAVLRETILLAVLGIIIGIRQAIYGIERERLISIPILIFYLALLYFFIHPRIKKQFK